MLCLNLHIHTYIRDVSVFTSVDRNYPGRALSTIQFSPAKYGQMRSRGFSSLSESVTPAILQLLCLRRTTRHDTTSGVQSGNAGTTYSQWTRVVAVALSPAAPARWQSTSACYLINCKSTLGARVHVQRMVWCFLRIYSLTTAVSLKTDGGGAVLCPARWRGTSACR